MSKVKRGVSVDTMYLGKEPSWGEGDELNESERRLALYDALGYYNYRFNSKDHKKVCVDYAKRNLPKGQLEPIKACATWRFNNAMAGLIRMSNRGWKLSPLEEKTIKEGFTNIVECGKMTIKELDSKKEEDQNKVVISPMQRLENKIYDTIIEDLTIFEDEWMSGNEKAKIDIFARVQSYGLSGSKVAPYITEWATPRLEEYTKALSKKKADEQIKEAYSHLKPATIKARIKVLEGFLSEAEQLTLVAKATRKPRKPKVKTADKQVEKLKYEKTNTEYKLNSINPVDVIGAHHLLTFNTKYKILTEYVTTRVEGFEVKGTTLQHFEDKSRSTTLRKPEDFLKIALKKTAKQINKEWGKLTTKTNEANGRINANTILLRVL